MALKVAIAAVSVAQRHHRLPFYSTQVWMAEFWASKILPALFMIAIVLWARRVGHRGLTVAASIAAIAAIAFTAVVTYSMFHGWKGWEL